MCSTLIHLIRCTLTSCLLFSFQSSQLHLAVSTFRKLFHLLLLKAFGTFASPSGSNLPAAASIHNHFCIIIKRRKSHLPDFPKTFFTLGLLFLFPPFFFTCSSFLSDTKKLQTFALRFVHQMLLLYFTFFFFFFFSTSFLSASSELSTFLTGASQVLGSSP